MPPARTGGSRRRTGPSTGSVSRKSTELMLAISILKPLWANARSCSASSRLARFPFWLIVVWLERSWWTGSSNDGSIDALTRGLDPRLQSEIRSAQGDSQAAEDLEIAHSGEGRHGVLVLALPADGAEQVAKALHARGHHAAVRRLE